MESLQESPTTLSDCERTVSSFDSTRKSYKARIQQFAASFVLCFCIVSALVFIYINLIIYSPITLLKMTESFANITRNSSVNNNVCRMISEVMGEML